MARWDLPKDREIATKLVDIEARRQEVGVIGYLFGNAKNQPGNIGGTAVLAFSVLFGLFLFFGPDTPGMSRKDVLSILVSLITLSLGYVFGQRTTGR